MHTRYTTSNSDGVDGSAGSGGDDSGDVDNTNNRNQINIYLYKCYIVCGCLFMSLCVYALTLIQ
jgi:hypothetical protein